MFGNRLCNPTKKPDKAGVTWDKVDRLDMSGLGLWNPAKKSDKDERSDMFGLGAGHIRVRSLEPG
jgi:hypothetical protein